MNDSKKYVRDVLPILLLVLFCTFLYAAYFINFINGFIFIALLLLEIITLLGLVIFFRNDKVLKRRFSFTIVIVSILMVYELRLIYYDSYTYVVNSGPKPIEVIEESGIHVLLVNSFEVQHLTDENYIKESYERQFQPIISLKKISNKERYLSKNNEILNLIGYKQNDFEMVRKNLVGYFGEDLKFIQTFLNRKDIQGDSAGLALALTFLWGQGEIKNDLDFGVTGALNSKGEVLEIGSIREKVIISEQNGFPYIILPTSNAQEAKAVKEELDLNIEIFQVGDIEQAIDIISELNET